MDILDERIALRRTEIDGMNKELNSSIDVSVHLRQIISHLINMFNGCF